MLELVNLEGNTSRKITDLSGGEQQRVALARALVTRPDILLADEPTGNLDPELSLEIMNLFQRFNDVGVTLLIASHDLALVERLGKRRIILESGRLKQGSQPGGFHR